MVRLVETVRLRIDRRQILARAFIIRKRQPQLLEVVLALTVPGCLAGLLNRRQQQCHQQPDDRDHDQQLDQRKRAPRRTMLR